MSYVPCTVRTSITVQTNQVTVIRSFDLIATVFYYTFFVDSVTVWREPLAAIDTAPEARPEFYRRPVVSSTVFDSIDRVLRGVDVTFRQQGPKA